MIHKRTIKLSLDGESLPNEFRLFTKGWNDTENGRVLFDDAAAKSVMKAYVEWGVDVMIDLEHQSLDVEAGAPDPTARDARGWCKLELRNGELWAVSVTWTPDGARRLTEKTQRYVSPALALDRTTKRVLKMINIAIVAMPATHKTPALVAASVRGGQGMDPELVLKALEALEGGDAKAALDILKQLIASAAGAEPPADGDEPGTESDGAEGVAPAGGAQPTGEKESVIDPKVENSAMGEEDEDGEDKPEKKASYKAMRLMLRRLAGVSTFAEAVAQAEIWRASHLTLETERKQLAAERATLESAERRRLVVELIQLKAEFPGTVWADATAKNPAKLKARWQNMPIAELRAHVGEQRAARGGKNAPTVIQPPKAPATGGSEVDISILSATDLRYCKDAGCDPKDYALLKARRDGALSPRGDGQ